jgi:hypothetical protein
MRFFSWIADVTKALFRRGEKTRVRTPQALFMALEVESLALIDLYRMRK